MSNSQFLAANCYAVKPRPVVSEDVKLPSFGRLYVAAAFAAVVALQGLAFVGAAAFSLAWYY